MPYYKITYKENRKDQTYEENLKQKTTHLHAPDIQTAKQYTKICCGIEIIKIEKIDPE